MIKRKKLTADEIIRYHNMTIKISQLAIKRGKKFKFKIPRKLKKFCRIRLLGENPKVPLKQVGLLDGKAILFEQNPVVDHRENNWSVPSGVIRHDVTFNDEYMKAL